MGIDGTVEQTGESAPSGGPRVAVVTARDQGWQQAARCCSVPSEVFFPENRDSPRQRRAQGAPMIDAVIPFAALIAKRGEEIALATGNARRTTRERALRSTAG